MIAEDKGVLIPVTNSEDLVLNKEVEEAIQKDKFHIYTMENLQDAIEVMILDEGKRYIKIF